MFMVHAVIMAVLGLAPQINTIVSMSPSKDEPRLYRRDSLVAITISQNSNYSLLFERAHKFTTEDVNNASVRYLLSLHP